jgi:pimeloyl-ACP methyl ester carboxylesterase
VKYSKIDIGDTSLHYMEEGHGSPILFVHGAAASMIHGQYLSAYLSKGYRFISLSQRFHLPNDPQAAGHYNADQHANDLIRFIEALDLPPCKVIAHSYGCSVVLTAASIRKELFTKIVLAEPSLAFLINDEEKYLSLREERADTFRRIRVCFDEGKSADAVATLMRYANGSRGFIAFPEQIRWDMTANASALQRMITEQQPSTLNADMLKKITAPITILLGKHCIPMYKAVADEFSALLPSTTIKIIENAAHDLVYTQPRLIFPHIN